MFIIDAVVAEEILLAGPSGTSSGRRPFERPRKSSYKCRPSKSFWKGFGSALDLGPSRPEGPLKGPTPVAGLSWVLPRGCVEAELVRLTAPSTARGIGTAHHRR